MPWQRKASVTSSELTRSEDGGGRSGVAGGGVWPANATGAPTALAAAAPAPAAAPRASSARRVRPAPSRDPRGRARMRGPFVDVSRAGGRARQGFGDAASGRGERAGTPGSSTASAYGEVGASALLNAVAYSSLHAVSSRMFDSHALLPAPRRGRGAGRMAPRALETGCSGSCPRPRVSVLAGVIAIACVVLLDGGPLTLASA